MGQEDDQTYVTNEVDTEHQNDGSWINQREARRNLFILDLEKAGFTDIAASGAGFSSLGIRAKNETGQVIFFKIATREYTQEDLSMQKNEDSLLDEFARKAKDTTFEGFAPKVIRVPSIISTTPFRAFTYIDGTSVDMSVFRNLDMHKQLALVEKILLLYDFMQARMQVHDTDYNPNNFKINDDGELVGKIDWDRVTAPESFLRAARGADVLEAMPIVGGSASREKNLNPNTINVRTTRAETIRKVFDYFIPSSGKHPKLESEHFLFNSLIAKSDIPLSLKLLVAPTATPIVRDKKDNFIDIWNDVHTYKILVENITPEYQTETFREIDNILQSINNPEELENNRDLFNSLRWKVQLFKEKGVEIPKEYLGFFEGKNLDFHQAMAHLSKGNTDQFRKHALIAYRGLGNIESYFMKKYAETPTPNPEELERVFYTLSKLPSTEAIVGISVEMHNELQRVNWAVKIIERGSKIEHDLFREDVVVLKEDLDPELFDYFDQLHHLSAKLSAHDYEKIESERILQQRHLEVINHRVDDFTDSVFIDKDEVWEYGYNTDLDKKNLPEIDLALSRGVGGLNITADEMLQPIRQLHERDLSKVDRVILRFLGALNNSQLDIQDQFIIAKKLYDLLQKPLIYRPRQSAPSGATGLKEIIRLANEANMQISLPDDVKNIFDEVVQELVDELMKFRPINPGTFKPLKINSDEYI